MCRAPGGAPSSGRYRARFGTGRRRRPAWWGRRYSGEEGRPPAPRPRRRSWPGLSCWSWSCNGRTYPSRYRRCLEPQAFCRVSSRPWARACGGAPLSCRPCSAPRRGRRRQRRGCLSGLPAGLLADPGEGGLVDLVHPAHLDDAACSRVGVVRAARSGHVSARNANTVLRGCASATSAF